jgi:hypothetical protein
VASVAFFGAEGAPVATWTRWKKAAGRAVNIEVDQMARYAARLIEGGAGGTRDRRRQLELSLRQAQGRLSRPANAVRLEE